MGKGSGVALADNVTTIPQITVINGGANKVWFCTVLQNPARVQAAVPGDHHQDERQVGLQGHLQGADLAADRRGHPDHAQLA